MKANAKRTRRLAVIISCALYVYIYLLFHIPNYVFDPDDWVGTSKDVYLIIRQVSEKLVYYIVPSLAAAIIYVTENRVLRALRSALAFSLPVLIYSLPYCYLYAISSGYDTPESSAISLGISLVGLLIQSLHVFALYMLARIVAAYSELRKMRAESMGRRSAAHGVSSKAIWSEALAKSREDIRIASPFSTEGAGGLALLAIAFAEFAVRLVIELIQTVDFFVSAVGISTSEVITVLLSYVFLLAEMILVLLVLGAMKNRALREIAEEDSEDTECESEQSAE